MALQTISAKITSVKGWELTGSRGCIAAVRRFYDSKYQLTERKPSKRKAAKNALMAPKVAVNPSDTVKTDEEEKKKNEIITVSASLDHRILLEKAAKKARVSIVCLNDKPKSDDDDDDDNDSTNNTTDETKHDDGNLLSKEEEEEEEEEEKSPKSDTPSIPLIPNPPWRLDSPLLVCKKKKPSKQLERESNNTRNDGIGAGGGGGNHSTTFQKSTEGKRASGNNDEDDDTDNSMAEKKAPVACTSSSWIKSVRRLRVKRVWVMLNACGIPVDVSVQTQIGNNRKQMKDKLDQLLQQASLEQLNAVEMWVKQYVTRKKIRKLARRRS